MSLLEGIPDLSQQDDVFSWRCRLFRFLFLHFFYLLNDQENGKGDDDEINDGIDEDAIVDGYGGLVSFRFLEGDYQVGKINLAQKHADGRHYDVGNEGTDYFSEGGADDDADCQVDDVPLHGEFFEFLQHVFVC